jgi:hypothetical protein
VLPDWSLADIRSVLVAAVPAGEADLMSLSDRLLVLENAVSGAVRP